MSNRKTVSLRTKLVRNTTLTLLGVITATTGLVAVQNYSTSQDRLAETEQTLRGALETKGALLTDNHALALSGMVDGNAFGDVKQLIETAVSDDVDVTYGLFLDTDGRAWAFRSPLEEDTFETLGLGDAPDTVLRRDVNLYDQDILEFASLVTFDEEPLGTIRYGLSTDALVRHLAAAREAAMQELLWSLAQILGIGVLALGAGVALTRRSAGRITHPLTTLTEATQRIAKGERGVQAAIDSGDEIEILAETFNQMVREIEASQEALEAFNRELEQKVADRTRDLKKKTDDVVNMLENIKQGVFTIMPGQLIHPEYSAHLEEILGTDDIGDKTLTEVLLSKSNISSSDLDAVEASLNTGFMQMLMLFECNAHVLPGEFEITVGDTVKLLEAEWIGIADEQDDLSSVMVTLRDVTELRALRAEAEAQRERLEVVGQLLAIPARDFTSFMEASEGFIARNRALIAANEEATPDVISELFRNTHTIKGNARLLGLTRLNDVAHEAETAYRLVREGGAWDQQALLANESLLAAGLAQYRETYEEQLAAYATGGAGVSEALLAELRELVSADIPGEPAEALTQVRQRLAEADWPTLTAILETPVASLDELAETLGKETPQVVFEPESLRLPPALSAPLQNVFVHILRNALDHGLESADERTAAGKAAAGTVTIRAVRGEGSVSLWVSDDGRGLAIDRLREKAGEGATDEEAAEVIFESGSSTAAAVTDVSGRGVGMDAVRRFLEAHGGGAEIVLGAPLTPGHRAFSLRLTCALDPSSAARAAA